MYLCCPNINFIFNLTLRSSAVLSILILFHFFNPLLLADSNVSCTLDKATRCPAFATCFVNSQLEVPNLVNQSVSFFHKKNRLSILYEEGDVFHLDKASETMKV
jgi:hypothetical protein